MFQKTITPPLIDNTSDGMLEIYANSSSYFFDKNKTMSILTCSNEIDIIAALRASRDWWFKFELSYDQAAFFKFKVSIHES